MLHGGLRNWDSCESYTVVYEIGTLCLMSVTRWFTKLGLFIWSALHCGLLQVLFKGNSIQFITWFVVFDSVVVAGFLLLLFLISEQPVIQRQLCCVRFDVYEPTYFKLGVRMFETFTDVIPGQLVTTEPPTCSQFHIHLST